MNTSINIDVNDHYIERYMDSLVNKFFKILPMRESSERTLIDYLNSFQRELVGFGNFAIEIGSDSMFISIVSILQFFIDNIENVDCPVSEIRREVFHAISMCNNLKNKYCKAGVHDECVG